MLENASECAYFNRRKVSGAELQAHHNQIATATQGVCSLPPTNVFFVSEFSKAAGPDGQLNQQGAFFICPQRLRARFISLYFFPLMYHAALKVCFSNFCTIRAPLRPTAPL